jgi:hypothetical protein
MSLFRMPISLYVIAILIALQYMGPMIVYLICLIVTVALCNLFRDGLSCFSDCSFIKNMET